MTKQIAPVILALAVSLAGCSDGDDPSSSSPPESPGTTNGQARVATAVRGDRFEIEAIPVPGMVTIVEFTAPW